MACRWPPRSVARTCSTTVTRTTPDNWASARRRRYWSSCARPTCCWWSGRAWAKRRALATAWCVVRPPRRTLIHVHPDSAELNRVSPGAIADPGHPCAFAEALADLAPLPSSTWQDWREARPCRLPGLLDPGRERPRRQGVDLASVVAYLSENLPDDAVIANGAGNYAVWVHRFYRYRQARTQLAPTNGAMGYGLPAAIAASLRDPQRRVVCFAGDGCFMMYPQELATAAQFGATPVVIVVNNGMLGTIRMHQEREYPGRVSATRLDNPDFVALARAFGAHAERVECSGRLPRRVPPRPRKRTPGAAGAADRPAPDHAAGAPRLRHPQPARKAIRPGSPRPGNSGWAGRSRCLPAVRRGAARTTDRNPRASVAACRHCRSGESPAKRQASACTGRSKASGFHQVGQQQRRRWRQTLGDRLEKAPLGLVAAQEMQHQRGPAPHRKAAQAVARRRRRSAARSAPAGRGLAQRWRARASMSADRSAATKRQPGRNPASSASSPPAPQPTLSRRARSGRRASNCARLSRCSSS